MKIEQIALQLYTLREHSQSRDEFANICRRVAEIGYQAVQVSGVDRALVPEADIKAICRDHGLTICATHESGEDILRRPREVVTRLQALDCRLTAYPYPKGIDFGSEADVTRLIGDLDAAGKILSDAGITLAYHNHQIEFRHLNGKRILDRIYAETDPRHLQGEPDTYWIQYGGGDPVEWCHRLSGRLPLIHLKDYRINGENQIEFAEIGAGNLHFPAIIKAAEDAGCRWFVVEQDSCPGDPFESITQSFRYLSALAQQA